MKKEFSILIGGKAGDGIRKSGRNIAELFNLLGFFIFVYEDYPSIIRGGHNFSIIRASSKKILAHEEEIDVLVAFDQKTVDLHKHRLKKDAIIIFDSDVVKAEGLGFSVGKMSQDRGLPPISRNSALFAILSAYFKIDFSFVEKVIKSTLRTKVIENIVLAKDAYKLVENTDNIHNVQQLKNSLQELITGNEALGIGAVKGGLEFYVAYPMTPATALLNFLAANTKKYNVNVVQAENEISVIGMAQGAAVAGKRSMIATSGGGFALMTEHISMSGQAEIPLVLNLGQRPGPASGIPTYSTQGDLLFAIHAGHGEFPKIVVAPGDIEETIEVARDAINLAWQYQVIVIILTDKHILESTYSTNTDKIKSKIVKEKLWDKKGEYQRYKLTKDGISPLAFPGQENVVVKTTSYEHDEYGLTTEEGEWAVKNVEKRRIKETEIIKGLKKYKTVKVYGDKNSKNVLLTWGSTKGAVLEAAERTGCKVVQPLYLTPFPSEELANELKGAKNIIGVECNATAQLSKLAQLAGIQVNNLILKYDGRPFTPTELEKEIKKII